MARSQLPLNCNSDCSLQFENDIYIENGLSPIPGSCLSSWAGVLPDSLPVPVTVHLHLHPHPQATSLGALPQLHMACDHEINEQQRNYFLMEIRQLGGGKWKWKRARTRERELELKAQENPGKDNDKDRTWKMQGKVKNWKWAWEDTTRRNGQSLSKAKESG